MRLVQFTAGNGQARVARVDEGKGTLTVLKGVAGTYELAQEAIAAGKSLADLVAKRAGGETVDYATVVAEGRLLPPILHADPAHLLVTGTGLTHLGSASARAAMHQNTVKDEEELTDSMKMFRWGIEGGKPRPGKAGIQPEWFYKGDGGMVAAPGQPLVMPDFSLDGGEEPEISGIYLIGPDGTPFRLGFTLGNEFSDHVTERHNYLYLAHSKLRACSFGPELLLGDLPGHVAGKSRVLRDGKVLWEAEFVSGEDNMSHTIANLEHHHFKYPQFRRPGDVHCHFFGTATLSFAAGIKTMPGDVFEIEAAGFGEPLRNPLAIADCPPYWAVRPLQADLPETIGTDGARDGPGPPRPGSLANQGHSQPRFLLPIAWASLSSAGPAGRKLGGKLDKALPFPPKISQTAHGESANSHLQLTIGGLTPGTPASPSTEPRRKACAHFFAFSWKGDHP